MDLEYLSIGKGYCTSENGEEGFLYFSIYKYTQETSCANNQCQATDKHGVEHNAACVERKARDILQDAYYDFLRLE